MNFWLAFGVTWYVITCLMVVIQLDAKDKVYWTDTVTLAIIPGMVIGILVIRSM